MNTKHHSRQSGFTLIEIAIVLVIIGLLLGGVMKGQTMVQNAKIKRMATDTQSVQSAINSYVDSYWQLPGDDSGAGTRFTVAAGAGNADGVIAGLFEPAVADLDDAETARVWNHLRCAELVKGDCVLAATAKVLPRNPLGGILGIAHGATTAVLGMSKKMVCMGSVSDAYAEIYDVQNDDGVGTTGEIRGSADTQLAATPGVATAYTTGNNATIHVCSSF